MTSPGHSAAVRVARARAWLAADPDPQTRAELDQLIRDGDDAGLADRFDGRLQFGTAGLRGPLGAGPRRMNRLLVRQAAAGLANYVGAGALVAIGYDARHKSRDFAFDSARVLIASGCRVAVLARPLPTPVLAFAIRQLGAAAGVMVTASHNPAGDNGYKVYLGDGAQIVPPADEEISEAIDAVGDPSQVTLVEPDHPELHVVGDEVEEAYVAYASAVAPAGPRDVEVVYTPMHGVGGPVMLATFERAGFAVPAVVVEQYEPDGDFPTVPFPNPEEPGALDLALALAERRRCDVVIANDPDADRLGVAVVDHGRWRRLTGNEVGALLADHVLASTEGDDRLVVTTFVSSRLLASMAEEAGVHYAETLTGFKWVVRPGLARPDLRFVFGYEEALGYAVAEYVRDKDGITAALLLADLVARRRAEGRTVLDQLTDIADRHGFHGSVQWSARADGPGGHERIASVMDRLRSSPPRTLAGMAVGEVHDYLSEGPLPPTDAVRLDVGDARVVVRPSGTEPKLKCYLDTVVPLERGPRPYETTSERCAERLEALRAELAAALGLS